MKSSIFACLDTRPTLFYTYTLMNDIHSRLKEIRQYFKLSIREFSKEISYSHGVYGQVEHGDRPPTDRIIQLITSKFNINKEWLLTGHGKMFDSSPIDIRLKKILQIYNTVDNTYRDFLLEQSKLLLKFYKEK
jgi:transcriptional regulator with XRE-family HTH domain